ncbi:conserved hypothetical protein [Ricinus communis]|uniref:UvrD-like helicase ATP-binding domain-containing protein n=1 Tax=Ricinus communis TaxID=3988 RepID=B9TAL0_RICCO|nr:conserved hypothetical protein [Ricinus communis]
MDDQHLLLEDTLNRQRALELESFIVEAPAGAGKTELLTQRYLKLLAVVNEPEEIVAITFTNKAAAEMRSRVLQSLQDAADAIPIDKPHKQTTRELALHALARSAELGWDLLAQPGRLRINTIDSLSSNLARQMPLMSRFGAQPAVSEDVGVHYLEAARRTLAMLEDEGGNGAVTEALRYLDNDTVRLSNLLAEMLARRDQWLEHAGRQSVLAEVEAALRHLIQQDIAAAAAVLTPRLQQHLMSAARYAASNLACDCEIALLVDWETTIPPTPEALSMWRSACELLLTQKGDLRKSVTVKQGFPPGEESKPYKEMLAEVIASIADASPLARLRELPDPRGDEDEHRIVTALAIIPGGRRSRFRRDFAPCATGAGRRHRADRPSLAARLPYPPSAGGRVPGHQSCASRTAAPPDARLGSGRRPYRFLRGRPHAIDLSV